MSEEEKIYVSNLQDSFNIFLIGDSSVGKTSILERYCNNFFKTEKYSRTTIEIFKKILYLSNKQFQIKFWDIPNLVYNLNESEKKIIKNCDGIIYVCSYDDFNSLTHINNWYQALIQNIDLSNKEMILLINKNDLEENQKVIFEEQIDKKSKDLQLEYFEISAKTGDNVSKGIKCIIKKLLEKFDYKSKNKKDEGTTKQDNRDGCGIF